MLEHNKSQHSVFAYLMILKSTHIIFIFLLASSHLLSQDTVFISKQVNWGESDKKIYETDTVIFPSPMARHILVGTTVLTNSSKNEKAKNYGYSLRTITSSSCKKDKPGAIPEYIQEVSDVIKSDSIWTVNLKITSNCCYSFLGDIEVVEDTVLNLIYHGYGSYCFCTCCFGLQYEMWRTSLVNKKDLEYFMINGDRKTLKRFINKN